MNNPMYQGYCLCCTGQQECFFHQASNQKRTMNAETQTDETRIGPVTRRGLQRDKLLSTKKSAERSELLVSYLKLLNIECQFVLQPQSRILYRVSFPITELTPKLLPDSFCVPIFFFTIF